MGNLCAIYYLKSKLQTCHSCNKNYLINKIDIRDRKICNNCVVEKYFKDTDNDI